MKTKIVSIRCEDNLEVCAFTRYEYKNARPDFDISIADSFIGYEYQGFFGRFRRAWRAFWDKPVVYTSVCCEDKEKMKKFLTDCLALVEEE